MVRKPLALSIVCVVATSVYVIGAFSQGADWPMWRYDAGHTAASPEDLPDRLYRTWTRQYPPRVPVWDDPLNQDLMPYDTVFEPVVAGGLLFVAFNDSDKVVALDCRTGEERWRFYADGPVRFSPVCDQGRVYLASDDGRLYCLRAADGQLEWRFRGAPSPQKAIGNGRVISAWPARGGPVVRDGTVYFAASVWPFMGTFLYALDGRTGDVRWINDATGADFIKQPHAAPSFAGVAPQGQLAATADILLVPGGRSLPAAFDRHTGQPRYFDFGGRGQGGSFVAADESRFFVHTRVRGTAAFKLADGTAAGLQINEPVLAGGVAYAANTPATKDGQPAPAVVQAFGADKRLLWQIEADGSGDLIKAGRRLYAAGKDTLVAIDLPQGDQPARVAWSVPVTGRIRRLLAGHDMLFAVTWEGQIRAFAGQSGEATMHREDVQPISPDAESRQRADRLLQSTGVREGYALWLGADDERLLEAVLAATELHVVVLDPDADRVARLRRRFDAAGLYGRRVAVHQGDLTSFAPPVYIASLVAVGESLVEAVVGGPHAGRVRHELDRLYESVRPYGGKLWLPVPGSDAGGLEQRVLARQLAKARVTRDEGAVVVTREGALPGAADWTHAYGDIANTVKSNDQRVKLPLGVLWFGGNSNLDILPRHGHGPSEQVVGGRLFIEGMNGLSARDVYTGRVLWKRDFDDLGTRNMYYDTTYADTPLSTAYNQVHIPGVSIRGTNYVATEEGVYLVIGNRCLLLDAATGGTLRQFDLPAEPDGSRPLWAFVGVYENLLLAGTGFGDYSRRLGYQYKPDSKRGVAWSPEYAGSLGLLAFDRHTGSVLWRASAVHSFLHNGIVAGGGRIYCLDKLPQRVEDQYRRRGERLPNYRLVALDARSGEPVWQREGDSSPTREREGSDQQQVFGTWLGYSAQHDVLLEAGAAASDRSPDEVAAGMAAFRGADGTLLWDKPKLSYAGPCMIHNDIVITNTSGSKESTGAFRLRDGSPVTIAHPLTGEPTPWTFTRSYGCNTAVASEHLLTFRSGAAGFYDLTTHCGTGNFGGFKSGCSSNLIAADGVLNAPDYTRTCTCTYQNQTSLALVHTPDVELWTYNTFRLDPAGRPVIRRIGLNLGAPGDRRADDGTLWLDWPPVGGASPGVPVELEGQVKWFRHHSSRITGEGPAWVAASGAEGLRKVSVTLVPDEGSPTPPGNRLPLAYTVRLYFVEPDANLRPGERTFDVVLQGQTVLRKLDVIGEAGQAWRSIVKSFPGTPVTGRLTLELQPTSAHAPVLCGVEIVAESPQ
jgi:outer membrane protein assembly factor BamB